MISVETLKVAINPADFYRAALPNLKGKPNAQGWILAVCPFHGDSAPSLSVNLKHGGFHCFGCGEKGDWVTFHARLNRLSFRDAVNDLARQYLLTLEN
ncbi:MAG: CHC2 zinc finger domain-containing protein [Candidatus Competibacter denitrificans]|jgi:DNA primase